MICFYNESHDPYFNLAVEEYFLKEKKEEFLIISVNDPSVIIGKHQVAHRETDTEQVTRNQIPVIRRISGGGSVYHDHGNVNFAFILNSEPGRQVDFRKYTLPVIEFLKYFGVNAEFGDKNDIRADGFKISGNAEHVYRNRVLHHGTLLFDANLQMLRAVLRKDTHKYVTRAVRSNPSPVTNLKGKIRNIGSVAAFITAMMVWLSSYFRGDVIKSIEDEDAMRIYHLSADKYRRWDWNYGYGPQYEFSNDFILEWIPHSLTFEVKDGIIVKSKISGLQEMERISSKIEGLAHMPDELYDFFRKYNCPVKWDDIFNFF